MNPQPNANQDAVPQWPLEDTVKLLEVVIRCKDNIPQIASHFPGRSEDEIWLFITRTMKEQGTFDATKSLIASIKAKQALLVEKTLAV